MELLMNQIRIQVNEKLYLKDPNSSATGKAIIQSGIELVDEMGIEEFTFGKLSKRIGSPESTIYRYFENKHRFLLFITAWYWSWLEHYLVFATNNISDASESLRRAIVVLTVPGNADSGVPYIDMERLNRIVVCESSKSFLHKHVDDENKEGFFAVYKRVVQRVSDMILRINADFQYPHTLVSTIIESAHHQKFFSDHIPSLTDVGGNDKKIAAFFTEMTFKTIEK